jgi:hypothetical protein
MIPGTRKGSHGPEECSRRRSNEVIQYLPTLMTQSQRQLERFFWGVRDTTYADAGKKIHSAALQLEHHKLVQRL